MRAWAVLAALVLAHEFASSQALRFSPNESGYIDEFFFKGLGGLHSRYALGVSPLQLVGEYLPLRVYLVAGFTVESMLSVWEVAFSPGNVMGAPVARKLSQVSVHELGCRLHLMLGHIVFLPSRDTLMISCTSPENSEHTVFWDPYLHSETLRRLPLSQILAVSDGGGMLVGEDSKREHPTALWHLDRGRRTVLSHPGTAMAAAFSNSGDQVALLVDVKHGPCCRLEVWSVTSGKLLCSTHAPLGDLHFFDDHIAVHGLRTVFALRPDPERDGGCLLVRDHHDMKPRGTTTVLDMHLPSGRTLEFNATAVVVSRGPDILDLLELNSTQMHARLSPDGRSALLSFIDAEGNFVNLVWPFADGTGADELRDGHSPSFSPDGNVLATLGWDRGGANFSHLRGGGSIFLRAGEGDRFHGVVMSHPKVFGF